MDGHDGDGAVPALPGAGPGHWRHGHGQIPSPGHGPSPSASFCSTDPNVNGRGATRSRRGGWQGRSRGRGRHGRGGPPPGGTSRRYARHSSSRAGDLDDEPLDGDPVRVEYASRFLSLIDAELETEQEIVHERLSKWADVRLAAEGYAIFSLSARKRGYFFGMTMFEFSLINGNPLPNHKFIQGDLLMFSRVSPIKEMPLSGMVFSRSRESITAVVKNPPGNLTIGLWRLDQGANTVAHDRMAAALKVMARDEAAMLAPSFSWAQAVVRTSQSGGKPTSLGHVLFPDVADRVAPSVRDAAAEMPPQYDDVSGDGDGEVKVEEREESEIAGSQLRLSDEVLKATNVPQQRAIAAALRRKVTIIHGPPGTGKTLASVLCIYEWRKFTKRPILAVADSNVAVDNLLGGLLDLGVRVVRIGQPVKVRQDLRECTLDSLMACHSKYPELMRRKDELDELHRNLHSMTGRDRGLAHRDLSRGWSQYRQLENTISTGILAEVDVVCSTLIGAGSDVLQGMYFPYVLIDEATQATEPAAMVALSLGSVQVVLAGDHCQLPPVVVSNDPEVRSQLGVSLFERLVLSGVETHVLVIQYRMHPVIAHFPSSEFYDGLLKNGVDKKDRRAPPGFPWPRPDVPLAFVPVRMAGVLPNETADEKSKRNFREASMAVKVVEQLLRAHARGEQDAVGPNDIGVVTPYLGQVALLIDLLRQSPVIGPEFARLEIRTVDGFQGREKELIVYSAVRSNPSREVGFLADWRRLNVAITRPRRGLVLIGDPDTLCSDVHMARWVDWVHASRLVAVDK